MRNIFIYPIALCFLFQSCDLLSNEGHGTGTINVMIDGKYYEASNVAGTEYFGFHCSGKILGNIIGLGLGIAPHSGDTLTFLNKQTASSYDIYVIYSSNYGIKESGKIIVTKKSGAHITGKFYCKIVNEQDTLDLTNGNFNIDFPPSD